MRDSQPCSAATLNSSSGIESANFLASRLSVAASKGFAVCWLAAVDGSTTGGRYALFLAPKSPEVGLNGAGVGLLPLGPDVGDESDVVDEENDGDVDHSVDTSEPCSSNKGDGGQGRSTPSISPSRTMSPSSSSSVEGKKLRKRASACHFEAFLNSTQTSILPGLESAGSKRSKWFVVLYNST
jgi:hypothetical protein